MSGETAMNLSVRIERSLRELNSALCLTLSLALVAGSLSTLLIAPSASAADKPKAEDKKGPKVSAQVGKPLQAALDAIGKKDYAVASAKLAEAEAFAKKTPYDEFQIGEIRGYLYTSQGGNYPEVIAIYEKSLATPEYLSPEAAAIRPKQLALLYFNTQNYPKAIEYGKSWMSTHPEDQAMLVLVGKSEYLTKDYKAALTSMESAVAAAETAGKVPEEQWLQLVSSCAGQLDDEARIVGAYEKLVRYYPSANHWDRLLDRALRAETHEAAVLYVFRLMSDTGVLKRADQYLEYAQLAGDKAMPGEALTVMEAGFEKKLLGVVEKDKAGQEQRLADTRKKAQADKAQLPELEKEAASPKATTGQLSAGLGLAYFSFGMYEQAIAALDTGIKKGGLKNTDDYRMALGISQLRTGQKDVARSTFQSIPANSPFARIAKFWTIRTYN
jgi:tetratricopeptide (TPR) repeat protein